MKPAAPLAFRGILLMILAVSLFPIADGIAKRLTSEIPIMQIIWGRYAFQMVFILFYIGVAHPWRVVRTERFRLQAARAFAGWASNIPFITALAFIPIADAFAASLVAPLMVTALSVPLLGEQVGIRRWTAVAFGFAGALIVARPGLGLVHWATMLPLASAALFAFYQIGARQLASTDRATTTFFYATTVGFVINSVILPFVWVPMSLELWGLMALMGLLFALSHLALTKAFDFGAASVLAPFVYFQIASATVVGFVFFGDLPDRWTIVGTLIVIASGLYVAYRESRISLPLRAREGA
ncbi:MAG: DMT family transporter [Alphaproteobacteria bacterium]